MMPIPKPAIRKEPFRRSAPFLLRHATQHHETFARSVKLLVVVQAIEDLLFGFVADGAGVVEDQVGSRFRIDLGIAFMAKRANDLL